MAITETIIVGEGQAGLATSYWLEQHGREHFVLEKADRPGSAWQQRWDSFTLVTPNWSFRLPGGDYGQTDPHGFMGRDQIIAAFEDDVARHALPVRFSTEATSVEAKSEGGYLVHCADGASFEAANVVIASGSFQRPRIPADAVNLPANIVQMHSTSYRNPRTLPEGAVLVVGSGQSGAQIAEEIYQSGRTVYLCVGIAGRAPRRYRGRDCWEWLSLSGFLDRTVDKLPSPRARFAGNPHISGRDGGHTLNLHQFARDGMQLLGHLRNIESGRLVLAPDLHESLIRVVEIITELDLSAAGVSSVIWALGYGFDFSLVKLPVFDSDSYPIQERGVTAQPGLYFVGLNWLHSQKSGLLQGVGDDAAYIAPTSSPTPGESLSALPPAWSLHRAGVVLFRRDRMCHSEQRRKKMWYFGRKPTLVVRLLSLVVAATLLGFTCAPLAQAHDPDQEEANKAIMTRVVEEMINQGDLSVADEVVDPGYVMYDRDGAREMGIEGYKANIEGLLDAFPDVQVTIEDIFAEEDRVVVRYTLSSEAAGVSIQGIHIARLADGLIVESWENFDEVGLLMQTGQLPSGEEMAEAELVSVAAGFNGPQGILLDGDGNLWVIDAGVGGEMEIPFVNPETGQEETVLVGDTSRIVMVTPDGEQIEVATLPSLLTPQEASGGSRLAVLDGVLYATSGGWIEAAGEEAMPLMASIVAVGEGEVTEVANTWALEVEENPDGFILESHPYGLSAGPDGLLWVADAGANALLTVDPSSGEMSIVAVFDGVEGPFPNPARGDAMESDPVPTAVVVGEDGVAYVSLLPGFPFTPGSAKVVMVNADGMVSDYATGLTMLTDLRMGPDGEMYGVQFGQFGEQGPAPDSGAIIRVKEGDASEVVLDGLSFPTSLDFDADGNAYITINGVGAPGSGEVVMAAGLTAMAGEPIAPMMEMEEEMAEANMAVVQSFYDEFAAGNAEVILDVHPMTITMHYAGETAEIPAQALYENLSALKEANPDLQAEIHSMFAVGDYVFTELTWMGTHTGDLLGIPATDNPITRHELIVRRLEEGKIVESWEMWDDLAFLQSLGLVGSWDEIVGGQ
jgi:putative flavoprotein involved in K+ transport